VSAPLLDAENLHKHFVARRGPGRDRILVRAVDGVSLRVGPGEWVGLVGESGCGKSTLARLVLRLLSPTSGRLRSEGQDVMGLRGADLRAWRRRVQIVFQDTSGSLNPRLTVGGALGEVLTVHGLARGEQVAERVSALLEKVGLDPAQASRYPHELSGGQRQRVGIARALAVEPVLLVCDEPVSALDVSVQAQILNLLRDLRDDLGLACLFISHDLRVVRQVCSRIAVMYLGRIVEEGPAEAVYEAPLHPYTRALLAAVPEPVPGIRPAALRSDVASALRPVAGCAFAPRCPEVMPSCRVEDPHLEPKTPHHAAACLLYPGPRQVS
jgi:peptide/nickel transport system ATP-binding protein/oligopeptide transport system ATP-binding protein